jgi:hypothetical protein
MIGALSQAYQQLKPQQMEGWIKGWLLYWILFGKYIDSCGQYQLIFEKGKEGLAEMIKESTKILWRTDLWIAAQKGSDAFINHCWRDHTLISPIQFWVPDGDMTIDTSFVNRWPKLKEMHFDEYNLFGVLLLKHANLKQIFSDAVNISSNREKNISATQIYMPRREYIISSKTYPPAYALGEVIPTDKPMKDSPEAALIAMSEFLNLKVITIPHIKEMDSRQARREKERKGFKYPDIRVVQLRRSMSGQTHHDEGSKNIEWSCRWLVAGHWRNQWYPSINNHRPVYIAPYVKGPEDQLLKKPTKSIYAVVR